MYEHTYKSVDDGKLEFLCFCGDDMVSSLGKLVCPNKRCKFAILLESAELMMANGIFRDDVHTITLPICKTCNGSTLDCYRNPEWEAFLEPVFRCSCQKVNQMLITLASDRANMEKNFNIRPRTKKSTAGSVLPAKQVPVLPTRPTTLKPEPVAEEIINKKVKKIMKPINTE